jgi:hypothetical protein
MRLKGRQLRFLMTAVGGWTMLRIVATLPGAAPLPVRIAAAPLAKAYAARADAHQETVAPPALRHATVVHSAALMSRRAIRAEARTESRPARQDVGTERTAPTAIAMVQADPVWAPATLAPGPALGPAARRSRWTVSGYVFSRPGGQQPSLAGGGSLGGSQIAGRVTYRLNPGEEVRIALAARAYAPLHGKGAEVAAGVDWHPLPGRSLRLSVERRVGLDAWGRDAWSAYAAGGFYAEPLRQAVVDGYAQGGVVGTRTRDLFADGAVRVGHRASIGATTLVAGGGIWAAAQPRAERIDAGPRLALTIPVADGHLAVAAEGRFRVAGDARPGSGAALTVAVDF